LNNEDWGDMWVGEEPTVDWDNGPIIGQAKEVMSGSTETIAPYLLDPQNSTSRDRHSVGVTPSSTNLPYFELFSNVAPTEETITQPTGVQIESCNLHDFSDIFSLEEHAMKEDSISPESTSRTNSL
jgi:hypothetical protein